MPQLLSTFNLSETYDIVAQGFFNQEEKDLESQVVAQGSGYYRCTQLLTGAFISVEKVTEILEEAYETYTDRLIGLTNDHRIIYINVVIPSNE